MIFIYFNFIRIKTFIDNNTIEKVACTVFCIYIFDFITHGSKMIIKVFVWLNILSNNSK